MTHSTRVVNETLAFETETRPRRLILNYRLFVPKTFHSQERKVPMENCRSPGAKVPGTFVPGTFRSRELSFLGPFVTGNFRSHYPTGLVAALLCVLNYCMFGCDFTLMMLTPL